MSLRNLIIACKDLERRISVNELLPIFCLSQDRIDNFALTNDLVQAWEDLDLEDVRDEGLLPSAKRRG